MINVSGYGLSVLVLALETFPLGINVTAFPDDTDSLIIDNEIVAKYKMLYDGSLFSYTTGSAVIARLSVISVSDDDTDLKILLNARKGEGKLLPITDILTMTVSYPGAGVAILTQGTILSGAPADSITQEKRKRTNTYEFAFGATLGAQSTLETIGNLASGAIGLL